MPSTLTSFYVIPTSDNFCSSMACYTRLDSLRPGIGIEETRMLLQARGVHTVKIEKDKKATHLSGFEIQFHLNGRKVTYGVSDYDSAKRTRTVDAHGYVNTSPTLLQAAVDYMKDVLSMSDDAQ